MPPSPAPPGPPPPPEPLPECASTTLLFLRSNIGHAGPRSNARLAFPPGGVHASAARESHSDDCPVLTSPPPEEFRPAQTLLRTQYGALCWRIKKGRVQVLMVTSRDTGRWVIPKGWPVTGLGPAESAAREAWEEAGVRGRTDAVCLGVYDYPKMLADGRALPCQVAVYPLQVDRLARKFPERKQRKRHWFTPEKAALRVDDPGMAAILRGFAPAGAPPAARGAGPRGARRQLTPAAFRLSAD
ncbi:MAG: NUDIX hydrolase [Rhodobacterales bacterium]|nr:NUDIX hydrolase [Rhodobacterales bacterium]